MHHLCPVGRTDALGTPDESCTSTKIIDFGTERDEPQAQKQLADELFPENLETL